MNIAAKEKTIFLRWLARNLSSYAYMYSNEKQLHDAIATALEAEGIKFEREYVADSANRFDFLLDGGIVIEVKVHGSLADALRQTKRYCDLEIVNAVLIAATCRWAKVEQHKTPDLSGKPVELTHLRRQAL